MRFPLGFTLAQYRHRNAMLRQGRTRFPTVLMLEPLYTCNLACLGCAAERHTGKLRDRLPVEVCLKVSDECGAPIVNLCGGEPTLYPELPALVEGLIARNRYVLCCTNAIRLADKVFGVIRPSGRFFLMVHLDGLRETHDMVCRRPGVFDAAVAGIAEAKRRGYVVMLNTTVYAETRIEEIEELCRLTGSLKADGILVSPGYEYESAAEHVFLSADQISQRFRRIREFSPKYKVNVTPTFLDFAAGLVDLPCAPWSTVNYGPGGWRAPCYLIGERRYDDWETFWHETEWAYWESRTDRRCANCRMHSGFEHSAVEAAMRTTSGRLRLARWTLSK